jgi:RimJ/RimL family protein N-acetyltransferase
MTVDFRNLTEQLERVYSPRLALRQVALSDAWPLFAATRNPTFNRHLMWPRPASDEQIQARIDAIIEASRMGRLAAVCAVLKETGEWVSLFRFQPYAGNTDRVEMGIWTHEKFWNGRYSLELGNLCIDAAFALSDISVLLGAAAPDNKASCKLLELTGLVPTRLVFRQHESDSEVQLQEYEVTRESWAAARGQAAFSQMAVPQPALPRAHVDDASAEVDEGPRRASAIVHRLEPLHEPAGAATRGLTPLRHPLAPAGVTPEATRNAA